MITKYIIGIDKLELTLKEKIKPATLENLFSNNDSRKFNLFEISNTNFSPVYELKGFVLTNKHKRTQSYNLVYEVKYENELLGYLHLDNRSSNYSHYIGFKIFNKILYFPEWHKIMNQFLDAFDLQINNYTAVDIFIDSRQNMRDEFIKYKNDDNLIFTSRGTSDINYSGSTNINSDIIIKDFKPTFYIGKNKTGKVLSIYNKSEEIKKSRKFYIDDLHEETLPEDFENDVYRCELRLKNTYLRNKGYDIQLDKLLDTDYLKSIFSENIKGYFDFRENVNPNKSRCPKVPFFDFNIKQKHVVRSTSNNDSRKFRQDSSKVYKSIIRKMIKEAANRLDAKMIKTVIRDVAVGYDLFDYYTSEIKYLDFIQNPKKAIKQEEITTDIDFDSFF